jgi:hypothetical protein
MGEAAVTGTLCEVVEIAERWLIANQDHYDLSVVARAPDERSWHVSACELPSGFPVYLKINLDTKECCEQEGLPDTVEPPAVLSHPGETAISKVKRCRISPERAIEFAYAEIGARIDRYERSPSVVFDVRTLTWTVIFNLEERRRPPECFEVRVDAVTGASSGAHVVVK